MTETQLKNLGTFGLVATLVWLPLAFGSVQPSHLFYGQVAIQLLTFFALLLIAGGKVTVPGTLIRSVIPISLLGFFLVLQASLHFGPWERMTADNGATRAQLLLTLCLFELFCLTLFFVDSESRFKFLVRALLISGTFQAVYGTLMTVTGTDYIWDVPKQTYRGVATGTFINRNHLAGYLEMTLALGLGLMIANLGEGRSRTWRQFLRGWTDTLLGEKARVRICLVLMVIGLILTRSRMGNTAFFVGMGVAGLIGIFMFRKSQPAVVALFVSILIIDILLLGTFFGIDELQERIQSTNVEDEQRVTAVLLSLGLLPMAPWFGHGLGTFYAVFPQVRDETITLFYTYTHADLLQFPVELGVVGTAPLALLVLLTFGAAIRVQLYRHNRFYRAMGFAATMAIVSIMLHSTTDFNLQIPANAATFVCILAMPWIALNLETPKRRRSRSKISSADPDYA